jgi:hypothetical protein
MRRVSELTREQLEDIVRQVQDILWRDPATGELDPDRSWSAETLEWVSGVVEAAGLKPDPRPALPRTPNDPEEPDVAMRSALEAFISTIEATGGCIRPSGRTVGPSGEEFIVFEDDRPVPAGDDSWPDLADAYLLACRAMGRAPVIRGDDDEFPDDREVPGDA